MKRENITMNPVPPAMHGVLYSAKEVAELEGVPVRFVYSWCHQGLLWPCTKVGWALLINRDYINLGVVRGRGRPRVRRDEPPKKKGPRGGRPRGKNPVMARPVHGNMKKKK